MNINYNKESVEKEIKENYDYYLYKKLPVTKRIKRTLLHKLANTKAETQSDT